MRRPAFSERPWPVRPISALLVLAAALVSAVPLGVGLALPPSVTIGFGVTATVLLTASVWTWQLRGPAVAMAVITVVFAVLWAVV